MIEDRIKDLYATADWIEKCENLDPKSIAETIRNYIQLFQTELNNYHLIRKCNCCHEDYD